MDIQKAQFPVELLKVVQEVADSYFIAFDLEFTGVAGRRHPASGRLTLQQFYDDVRDAARRYQILQVGLTIVTEDVESGCYIAHPYNFNINPIPALKERHFTRIWSFQSGAVEFLLRNGFHFHLPLMHGIQYLSHKELELARISWIRDDEKRAEIPKMDTKDRDIPLINHIRHSIQKWQAQKKEEQDEFVNIPAESTDKSIPEALNRFQLRLTHQLVRDEFPNLKTTGMGQFIRVTNPTQEQQASEKLIQAQYRERELSKAIGFRWLIDAIIGKDITKMPDEYLLSALSSGGDHASPKQVLEGLQEKLTARRRILVGHNCFTDLVNLYSCFIGDLPDKVEDFQELVHELFPAVIDTKHMASFGKKWHNTALEDVEKDLRAQMTPKIEIPAEFDRYNHSESYHEAGYDSLLTAKIAIKLSAKLAKEGNFNPGNAVLAASEPFGIGAEGDEYVTAAESLEGSELETTNVADSVTSGLSRPVAAVRSFFGSSLGPTLQQSEETTTLAKANQEEETQKTHSAGSSVLAVKQKQKDWRGPQEIKKMKNALASTNIFDILTNGSNANIDQIDTEDTPDLMTFSSDEEKTPTTKANKMKEGEGNRQKTLEKKLAGMVKRGEMMPRWDGSQGFWQVFGNKLQVNGSLERVCPLT